ncbi:MAG: tetratricopeptide repeat protein [Caldilineaceae bacterium]|nr:tetratricopeptide repeat protein [Caldilineaceae bacterium]
MAQIEMDRSDTPALRRVVESPLPIRSAPLPPQHLTPFIGREVELAEIRRRLNSPACRLLTLVGPGGIGKTRLALHVASQLRAAGAQAAFVDLQPIRDDSLLVTAIADALGLPRGGDDPRAQLLRGLSPMTVLLVLDNFEHLLGAAPLLGDLLQAAPGVKILATSRVVLHAADEWLYPLGGMRYPPNTPAAPSLLPTNDGDAAEVYDAVQLFTACARRIQPGFRPEQEQANIIDICRLVEGMPLAIELAAAWTKTTPTYAIVEEIERNLGFLVTSFRNIPQKHRSIQVVFQRSWQLLSAEEQQVFQRLSIFRGGFDRAAAVHVAGASLPALAALVDKSLLRWRPNGRYEIHELLRQYAEEQLAQSAAELSQTRERHSVYFANFLGDQRYDLTTQQRTALAKTQSEIDNIRAAWQWAVAQGRLETIERAAMSFFAFCQGQSRYLEGVDALNAAVRSLGRLPPSPQRDRTLAELLTGRGWLELRLGRVGEAEDALHRARDYYAAWGLAPDPIMGSDPLAALPIVAVVRGDYSAAAQQGEAAWAAAASRNDAANLALAGYGLTSAAIAQGDHAGALRHAQETLALTKTVGNRWFMAYVYNHLGEVTQLIGDHAAAQEYYQASYTIREEFDDPEGMAVALIHLAELARMDGDDAQAAAQYQQSLTLYQGLGDAGGLVRALSGLGAVAHRLGDDRAARRSLQSALQHAVETRLTPLVLTVLMRIGAYFVDSGALEWGRDVLTFVMAQPSSDETLRGKVRRELAALPPSSPGHAPGPAAIDTLTLDALVSAVVAELAIPRTAEDDPMPAEAAPRPQLSERELEVLALVAEGYKNPEIADMLFVTLSTVKAHCNNIYSKLGVANRVQAVAQARVLGLVQTISE